MTDVFRVALRWSWRYMLAVALLLVLTLVAWVLSNLGDAPALPRPVGLAVPPKTLPDERNLAFAFQALRVAEGTDPMLVGRRDWDEVQAYKSRQAAALTTGQYAQAQAMLGPELLPLDALPSPVGQPMRCAREPLSCLSDWMSRPEVLARQRAPLAAWGRRCEVWMDGPGGFEEPLPVVMRSDSVLMRQSHLVDCSLWLRTGAVLALSQGDRATVLVQMSRALRLRDMTLAGARSPIGQMVAVRIARNTLDTVAWLAIQDRTLAAELLAMVRSPPDPRIAAARWIRHEAQFGYTALQDSFSGSRDPIPVNSVDGEDPPWQRAFGAVFDALAQRGIGLQPQRTLQRHDEQWLLRLQAVQPGVEAALQQALDAARQSRKPMLTWHWRNTFGEWILGQSDGHYASYLARQADVALHAELVHLLLQWQRDGRSAGQRQGSAASTAVSPALRQRLTVSADGREISVRTWLQDLAAGAADPRDVVAYRWP